MNDIDRIKIMNDLSEGQETITLAKNVSKYLSIIKGNIEYNNSDLDELITYFKNHEYFEQCEKLKKLKK